MHFSQLERTILKSRSFRPIYYLGCKTAFTKDIQQAINDVDRSGGRVLDLFAGTGVVASALAAERNVVTVDIQEYSRVLCSALLKSVEFPSTLIEQSRKAITELKTPLEWCFEPLMEFEAISIDQGLRGETSALIDLLESPPLITFLEDELEVPDSYLGKAIEQTIARLISSGLERSQNTVVSRNFGGVYFSYTQSIVLDACLSAATSGNNQLQDTLKAAALSTASAIVNTVGKQFAQPIQPRNKSGAIKSGLIKTVHKDRSADALKTYLEWLLRYTNLPLIPNQDNYMVQSDYLEGLRQHGPKCSVVYADPPYTRDHYSRFYHVLETMCLRDNPVRSKVTKNGMSVSSRGVYREDRHQSPFCIRSTAPSAFEALFHQTSLMNLPLVLSYSPHEAGDGTHPRVVSMNQILELAKNYYNKVDVVSVEGITHNQLNKTELQLKKREQAEIILKCFV